MKQFFARIGRAILWPVRKGLRLDEAFLRQLEEIQTTRSMVEAVVQSTGAMHAEYARIRFDSIDGRLLDIQRLHEVGRDAMVSAAAQFGAEIARLEETRVVIGREMAHRFMHESIQRGLPSLEPGIADLLNFAESHRGFSAQAGLFFNPPVILEYGEGGVAVSAVNERVVEVPFVMAALSTLPTGSRILDVGAGQSTLPLSLASLGYAVTALDLNGYPLGHPNLTSVAQSLEEFEPDASFDGVVCLSSIEHFGLGHFGPDPDGLGAGVRALGRLRTMVVPGGLLVLTVPFGSASVSDFQRVYDTEGLTTLLSGWSEVDVRIAFQSSPTTWMLSVEGTPVPAGACQVALVTARTPTN